MLPTTTELKSRSESLLALFRRVPVAELPRVADLLHKYGLLSKVPQTLPAIKSAVRSAIERGFALRAPTEVRRLAQILENSEARSQYFEQRAREL